MSPEQKWAFAVVLFFWSVLDRFTIGHSFESIKILGQTGSGKTSGPGQNIALAMLRAGYGFLITTTKPQEIADWQKLARQCGREADLVIVGPDGPHRINVLDYSYKAAGRKAANADNLTGMIMRMLAVRDRNRGQPTEPFWLDSSRMALTNIIHLLACSGEVITFPNIVRALGSLPESPEQARSAEWMKESYANGLVDKGVARKDLTHSEQNDLAIALEWSLGAWPRIYDRTRSGIKTTLDSLIFPWTRSPLSTLFGSDTTFTPEGCFEKGSIVILALDVKTYLEAGQLAQILIKTVWQQALERRDTSKNPRPICLWFDEAQNFVTDYDPLFQATARSSRTSVVSICQNINSLISRFPGPMGKNEALSLLGNFGTKIFCSNDDSDTNEFASKMCGEIWTKQSNVTAGLGDHGGMSAATSDQRRRLVETLAFAELEKGGDGLVEAYCFRSGRPFEANGIMHENKPKKLNYLKVAFSQNPK